MKTTHSLLTTFLLLGTTLAAPIDFAALGDVQDKRDYSASEFPSVRVPIATAFPVSAVPEYTGGVSPSLFTVSAVPEYTGGGVSPSLFPTAPGNCGVATVTYTFTYTATQLASYVAPPTYTFTYTATELATPTYTFTYTATQLATPTIAYTATQRPSSFVEPALPTPIIVSPSSFIVATLVPSAA